MSETNVQPSPDTLAHPFSGRFHAVSPYSAWLALVVVIIVLVVATAVGLFGGDALSRALGVTDRQIGIIIQMAIVFGVGAVLIVLATALRVRPVGSALALDTFPGWLVVMKVLGGMAAVLAPYNAIVFMLAREDMTRDLMVYAPMIRSAYWLVALLAIGVLAPVCEELMFRGFLLPAFAQSALRFRGAAFLTTFLWAALHAGYSATGLIEVGLIGLYFSYVLWRWGSLWLTILSHGIYNSLLVVAMRVVLG